MNQLGNFEQNLLTELRQVVAERATDTAERVPEPPRRAVPRRRLVLAGAGLFAAAVVLGVPALDAARTPVAAAYTVEANADGSVMVSINRIEDADGLERQLEAHGIQAEVDYTPPDTQCREPRYERGSAPLGPNGENPVEYSEHWSDGEVFTVVVRPALVGDLTLVITNSRELSGVRTPGGPLVELRGMAVELAVGPVGPCVLEDDPPR